MILAVRGPTATSPLTTTIHEYGANQLCLLAISVAPARGGGRLKTEGFGQVYVEAAACGKPSIGANVGGVPDAVLDGQTGLLVDSADPAAIAAGIRTLFTEPGLRERLGRAARERAHGELRWDRVIAQVETVLHEAVDEARRC